MFNERRLKQSEVLQLILLNALYSLRGSEIVIFQGGTALRWVYNGQRFSEDLDLVTVLPRDSIELLMHKAAAAAQNSCIAQFGLGKAEFNKKASRNTAVKAFFIFRPETQRERIAVKLEFELLKADRQPEMSRYVLRDLPQVAALIRSGQLILPYTSSLILAETPDEILSDKIRALFERKYIKGRDIYDIWWLVSQLNAKPDWSRTRQKLSMYAMRFSPCRSARYFLTKKAEQEAWVAIETDLSRFLPQAIYTEYRKAKFRPFLETLRQVIATLNDQGMRDDTLADPG